MPKVELPFEALLEATRQLDESQLETLAQVTSEMRRLQKKQAFQSEAEKVKEQYQQLSFSETEWQRYNELVAIRRQRNMNSQEKKDWHSLAERGENFGVARVTLLADFATRHGLSLSEVTRRLKLKASEAAVI